MGWEAKKNLGIQKSILNSNSKLWDCTKIILPKYHQSKLNFGKKSMLTQPNNDPVTLNEKRVSLD